MQRKKREDRPEGVYCYWETYPEHSGLKDNIFVAERVCGNGTVERFTCARYEAKAIFKFLEGQL